MKYTVVIPVYNGSETLFECLKAVTSQENVTLNTDYNVIVVDDGSTDNSAEIAKRFPVQVIELGKNKGRIVARRTGAMEASTDRLLFVDSRVTIPPDTVIKLKSFEHFPAVMGINRAKSSKYRSLYDTIFYLIRRRYYGKNHFPQQEEIFTINKTNFKRAPKGTTLLLIDKEIFLNIIPERTDKSVNDDTLLFHNLVFRDNVPLVSAKELLFDYSQRTDLKSVIPWLFERGIRFADFYLRPGGYYFLIFSILLTLLVFAVSAFILTIFYYPKMPLYIFLTALIIFIGTLLYLSESIKDFFISFISFPFVFIIFSLGVCNFYLMKFKKKFLH